MKVLAWLCAALVALSAPAVSAAGKDDSFPIDRVLGKADAPITIIEYASTTCGHCATFHKGTLPEVKKNWIDTGKAKLVYRDFPTGPAGLSIGASMIAHCAGPERYFGVLGLIMEQQDKWLGSKDPLDALKKTVRLAGLTGEDVDACLQRQDLFQGIQVRAEHGHEQFKIDSTPSFVVNGKLVVGAKSYEDFNKILMEAGK
ncbi:DsbA family protein [Magnetospirillum gryphiswaldense]|uniref:Protein-disulfide isomerase n=1 Tax=Magnetospirillum gryphiswaldense TaxID=55518 RepID=A4U2R1_9PROT|nr:DsbA family protein [Magnetospirillum gryphiswaldense]AVM74755.1 Disulfide bond formation protein D precursor [Magnetospirillum gryphiswaldense MSR-1]AVM78658.1 Disulfide bond formation protein D precursor [Magnetospirillum gryphiswaldense]CAM77168.1 Protein-disulfide isomerase [Magnetospirillum gryphiswaldense MSR-1]